MILGDLRHSTCVARTGDRIGNVPMARATLKTRLASYSAVGYTVRLRMAIQEKNVHVEPLLVVREAFAVLIVRDRAPILLSSG